MAKRKLDRPVVELDGSIGEGGGQLVRLAVALAAVTMQPVRIRNIRANRRPNGGLSTRRLPFHRPPASCLTPTFSPHLTVKRGRGAGLKSQHVTGIRWLADATAAEVDGLVVGSRELLFVPHQPPSALAVRRFTIRSESAAASALLVIQAVLPLVLFASGTGVDGEPEPAAVELEVSGGTNVSFSPSYEYLDQVLLPGLEDLFGVRAESRLLQRGWSTGPESSRRGTIWLRVYPLLPGGALRPRADAAVLRSQSAEPHPGTERVDRIDVSIVVPVRLHDELRIVISSDLAVLFPDAQVSWPLVENSGHDARLYILLVAISSSGLRWGADVLHSLPGRKKGGGGGAVTDTGNACAALSRRLCRDLCAQVSAGRVDEHLQDQMVCFQALAEGRTAVPRAVLDEDPVEELALGLANLDVEQERLRLDKARQPFGTGTLHCRTARWVAAEMLPAVKFYNDGRICRGNWIIGRQLDMIIFILANPLGQRSRHSPIHAQSVVGNAI